MPLPAPVVIRYVNDVDVYVMKVHPMEENLYAYYDTGRFERIGHVEKIHTLRRGLEIEEWEAHTDTGKPVHDRTRAAAVKKLLSTLGMYPIKPVQTIPRLF